MRTRGFSAAAVCLALAAPVLAGPSAPAPSGTVPVVAGTETLSLWPYTTSDFETKSDPVNLVFPNADPRAIRQELLELDGSRPPFALPAPGRGRLHVDGRNGLRADGLGRARGLGGRSGAARLHDLPGSRWEARSGSTSASSGSAPTPWARRTSRSWSPARQSTRS